ncbi:unnamed protein product [Linum tenue]|uniref:Uncharacterized protein n=1 Tax=Linum tenue TaxID=586396 RepID=A0AAV0LN44_9ROSI|nr:unnamed protein product [Linum tenue]
MALSDKVTGNLTTIYVAVIAGIKAYGMVRGRCFGAGFVLIASTTVVALILVATLTWDVSRKATYAISCGGICWHGVAVRSPASQVRFRLPHHHHHHQQNHPQVAPPPPPPAALGAW